MKTRQFKIKKTNLVCILAILFTINLQAQISGHWVLGGNTSPSIPPADDILTHPNFLGIRFSLNPLVNARPLLIGTGGISSIHVNAILGPNPHFVGIGVGFASPTQLLDVSGGNIDVLTANRGYMINDSYVLWHNGNPKNIMVGVGAGNTNPYTYCTFVGNNAGGLNTGSDATAVGHTALLNNASGLNTAVGDSAGWANTTGGHNVFLGAESGLLNTTGKYCTYTGALCAMQCNGSFNSAYGKHCMASALDGNNNCVFGTHADYLGRHDSNNVHIGFQAAYGSQRNDNVFIGYNAALNPVDKGDSNVMIGYEVGPTYFGGGNNVLLGARADLISPNQKGVLVHNAGAVGANSVVFNSNQFILGNDSQYVGVGLSNDPTFFGPEANLEIATENTPSYFPGLGTGTPRKLITLNPYGGTGFSGLKFRDLNAHSTPCTSNQGAGVLALDTLGNVIYVVDTGRGKGLGAGYCPNPTILTGDAGYDLNNVANFYYAGNFNGAAKNNVVIGNTCGYPPKAKLDVFQFTKTSFNTIGIYVENDDVALTTSTPIGIKSFIPPPPCPYNAPSVAGWFEAPATCPIMASNSFLNYSIFVPDELLPNSPGIVSIGYHFGTNPLGKDLLMVNSDIEANGLNVPSDRRFKTNFTSITNAIQKIDSIHPYYFYYDTVLWHNKYNFSSQKQVGFEAQNVDSVLPEVISKNDSGYYGLDYPKMTVLLLAGEQELKAKTDSIKAVVNQNNSLIQRVDSLSRALSNIDQCIANLCHDTNRREHRSQGIGNSNEQNVTLTSPAILYQNTPNPFGSGGTKITYFLPQNTMGASIVFYDMYGNQLQVVQLSQSGMGAINITPDKLSSGVYSYSLVIGGNVIDTKKMLFQK